MGIVKWVWAAALALCLAVLIPAFGACGKKEALPKAAETKPVPTADTADPPDGPTDEDDLYSAVFVEKTELRAGPGLEAEVLAELGRGDKVSLIDPREYDFEGFQDEFRWAKARVGEKTGWVIKDYLIRPWDYDIFREAERLALEGDAAGMVAALTEAGGPYAEFQVGPAGDRAVIGTGNCYSHLGYNTFYFESGRGIVRSLPRGPLDDGWAFSPDGGYVLTGMTRDPAGSNIYSLYFYDVRRDAVLYDGLINTHYDEATNTRDFTCEFTPGYFVWLEMEAEPDERKPYLYDFWPTLMAIDLATGEVFRVLEPDRPSRRDYTIEEGPSAPDEEVMLRPAPGELPEAVQKSELFQRFNGVYVEMGWGTA